MRKYYQRPTENFFILPNSIFDLRLEPIQFAIYSYLVSCAGSKGYCWPRQETIANKTGIGISSAQKHLKLLERRQLIEIAKHDSGSKYKNHVYSLLSLDNPEVYRDEAKPELPLFVGESGLERGEFCGIESEAG